MKTDTDINDEVLNEISRFKPNISKKELVNLALKEYLMYLRRTDLSNMIDQGIDWEGDLEQRRTA